MDNSTIQQLGNSLSLTDQNVDQLKALFPQVFCENKIDFSALKELLGENLLDNKGEHYGLSWVGRNDARKELSKSTTATLTPDKDKSVNFDNTENIFIEGENLEVLRILHKSYFGKIKMIYIDPPYNTGSDSFVYPDDYTETKEEYLKRTGNINEDGYVNRLDAWKENSKENGQYHSVWLSMMYSRLNYAHNLLSDDGVIFVSIDDNEQANLKLLMDSIFGQENFLVQSIWISGRTSSAHFTHAHEYILGYTKNKSSLPLFIYNGEKHSISDRTIKKPGIKNPLSNISFPAGIDFECEDKIFPKRFGEKEPVEVIEGVFQCENGKLKYPVVLRAAWAMRDMITDWLRGNEVIDQKGQTVTRFFFKSNGVLQYEKLKGTIHPNSIITGVTTKQGSNTIYELLNANDLFDFPKPVSLIKHLLSFVTEKNDTILDFFSGSGTTAQAVMEQNTEDGGNRKFICVQMPELTDPKSEAYKEKYYKISDITAERIRRAGAKIQKEQAEKSAGLFDGETKQVDTGFKYFRLTSSHFKVWQGDISKEELEKQLDVFTDATLNKSTSEEMLHELILKLGYPLTTQIKVMPQGFYFLPETEAKKGCCIALSRFDNEIIEAIETLCPQKTITLDGLFENDAALSNARLRFKDKGISLTII